MRDQEGVLYADFSLGFDHAAGINYVTHHLVKLEKDLTKQDLLDLGDLADKYAVMNNDDGKGGYILNIGKFDSWQDGVLMSTLTNMAEIVADGKVTLQLPGIPRKEIKAADGSNVEVVDLEGMVINKVELVDNGKKIKLTPTGEGIQLSNSPMEREEKYRKNFGFVYKGHIHYWYFFGNKVYIFRDPRGGQTAETVIEVPMSEYFACNEEQWNTKPPEDKPGYKWPFGLTELQVYILAAVTCVFLFVLIIGCIAIFHSMKKRRRRRRHHCEDYGDSEVATETVNNRHGYRSRTPPPHSRSPARTRRRPAGGGAHSRVTSASGQPRSGQRSGRRDDRRQPEQSPTKGPATNRGRVPTAEDSPTVFIFPEFHDRTIKHSIPVKPKKPTTG